MQKQYSLTTHLFFAFISIVVFCIQIPFFDHFSTDDAFISYRYARNLADGHGLVFNVGAKPVEGYSNFLWTILLAAISKAGFDLETTAPLLSLIFGMATCILLSWMCFRKSASADQPLTFAVLLPASAGFVLWSVSGLETTFFTFLITLGIHRTDLESETNLSGYLSAFIWGLAALTRPEGVALAAVFVGMKLFESRFEPSERVRTVQRAVTVLLIFSGHAMWRFWYYQAWLPNTFYAKTGSVSLLIPLGLEYVYHFLLSMTFFPLFTTIVLSLFRITTRRIPLSYVSVVLFHIVYIILVGGDWMPGFRFFQPIIPVSLFISHVLISNIPNRKHIRLAVLVSLFIVFTFGLFSVREFTEGSFFHKQITSRPSQPDVLKELGLYLAHHMPKETVIAVVPAGKIPYFSNLHTIDMRGLCDHRIARSELASSTHMVPGHMKRDPKYVLSQQPDVIITSGSIRKPGIDLAPLILRRGHFMDRWEILDEEEFKRCYKSIRIELPEGEKDLQYFLRICPKD